VISLRTRGGSVPAGDLVLQGIGQDTDWLSAHATPGTQTRISEIVRDAFTGRRLSLGERTSMVSAAPILVRNDKDDIDAATEGVVDPADLSFGYAWANDRQPRTMAGIGRNGDLILATAGGRDPGVSEGLTLAEEAGFMRELGAVDAMNLDGGGSTTMVVNGQLVNRPSDSTGERPLGDVVLAVPARP
jgi:exopolysaccharide biosynthesis protein